ncbi:hypothetical protein [Bacillus sp. AK128]
MTKSNEELLNSFKLLWTNRRFNEEEEASHIIKQAIITDLKDELSHPRTRTTPHKKFYLAVKRITHSSIPEEDQLQIIKLYIEELEQLS